MEQHQYFKTTDLKFSLKMDVKLFVSLVFAPQRNIKKETTIFQAISTEKVTILLVEACNFAFYDFICIFISNFIFLLSLFYL